VKRPVVLYDGDCRLCRFTARVAARFDRGRFAYLPFGDPAARPLLARLPVERRYASAHVVRTDGSVWSPTSALYRLGARNRGRLGPLVPDGPGPRRYP
jgi:predicted DCC family thiol-disulfide oxidoreductase YuxK